MSGRSHFPRWLIILVVVGLLWAVWSAAYQAGWTQGYQTAALTAAATRAGQNGAQGSAPSPYLYGPLLYGQAPWAFGRFYGPGFGFFPFSPLIGIGIFLVVIFLLGGFFRRMGYRHWAGGPGPHPWSEEEVKAWRERRQQQGSPEGRPGGEPEDRSAEDRPAE